MRAIAIQLDPLQYISPQTSMFGFDSVNITIPPSQTHKGMISRRMPDIGLLAKIDFLREQLDRM